VKEKGTKTVFIRGTSNEKARTEVMLRVLVDGHKMPQHVILRQKKMPREKVLAGLIFCVRKKTG
jgi:argonaute-like protein implicated in RNA metabolism and viral defense